MKPMTPVNPRMNHRLIPHMLQAGMSSNHFYSLASRASNFSKFTSPAENPLARISLDVKVEPYLTLSVFCAGFFLIKFMLTAVAPEARIFLPFF